MKTVYSYVVVRYSPNTHIDEFRNIGIVVLSLGEYDLHYKIFPLSKHMDSIVDMTMSFDARKQMLERMKEGHYGDTFEQHKNIIKSWFPAEYDHYTFHYSNIRVACYDLTIKEMTEKLYNEYVSYTE